MTTRELSCMSAYKICIRKAFSQGGYRVGWTANLDENKVLLCSFGLPLLLGLQADSHASVQKQELLCRLILLGAIATPTCRIKESSSSSSSSSSRRASPKVSICPPSLPARVP